MRPDLIGCDRCQVDIDSDRVLVGRPGRCCAADRLNPPQATRLQPVVRRGGNPACGVAPGGLEPVPFSHQGIAPLRVG